MNLMYDVRLGEAEKVIVAFETLGMILEFFT